MKKIYNSTITSANPIIKGHMVHGQNLLPGLAYIDMLYQLVQHAMGLDFRKHCLKRLYISNPLIVREDQPAKIRISFEKISDHWNIVVEETETDVQGSKLQGNLYMAAELHEETILLEEQINIEAMKQAATQCIDIETVYEQAQKRELVHQGIIKAKGNIYLTDPGCLIEVNMNDAYLDEAERFLFQPTLIDAAALAAVEVLVSKGNAGNYEDLYLPLYYGSFSCTEPLHTHCYAVVSLSSLRMVNEISTMDIVFFNIEGKQIGELKEFTVKRVRFRERINSTFIQGPRVISEISPQYHLENTKEMNPALTHIESLLVKIFSKHLSMEAFQIDLDTGFFDLGLQSSQLLAVMEDIGSITKLSISPTLLFEYTTIGELSSYFTEKYASQFDQLSELTQEVEQETPSNGVALDSPLEQVSSAVQSSFSDDVVENCVSHTIKQAGSRTKKLDTNEEEIAIIGMAGRFPGAKNIQEFWINLQEGKDCISEIPESRWDWKRFDGLQSPSGKNISRWGGFIDDPDCFDPQFFRISPREAETMDPQERLFLETCWEAIEDAGYTPKTLVSPRGPHKRRQVGVFVGVMHKDYTLIGAEVLSKGQIFPLSLNYAPIANRVSYFCNFHGPSMAIDTVCSSSITAIHLALESIRRGESEVALAGGVNLSLHSNKYLSYAMMDMYASDGRCHTFGKGGNGYVSGEAVSAVLLKPLHKAIQDQDHIYAVIKGSTINHVGSVSGITVPSPIAQADLIGSCLEKNEINPRTISYVEAHGTGTSLGDPIEIEGLVKAYRQYTQELQFCSIGSVKSNIGHTEAASGISGLIKVVLQLYNKTLVPSLHSKELNPYIDFEQSPFYVQHKTEEWKQPIIMENNQPVNYPRRAGLSSFGATGSNAHIILEEYSHKETQQQTPVTFSAEAKPAVILLSAKNEERLKAYAKKLLQFLREASHDNGVINLADIAYTLQVGREAMEERAVFIVQDISELSQKLKDFLQDTKEIEHFYRGHVTQAKNMLSLFTKDDDSQELIHKWMTKGKFEKVADLWAKGLEVDWGLLYEETRPLRISLPTYPFAREHYWVPKNKSVGNTEVTSTVAASLHPLLQQNTSDLSEQRFSSTFTGQEFFLTDHVIKGQKVIPGVAYLEMAREAVAQAAGVLEEGQPRVTLKNVVWIQPITVGEQPVRVHIGIYLEDTGEIAYEIYSKSAVVDSEPVVHCQGSAALSTGVKVPTLNLTALQAQCRQSTLSSVQCYEAFRAMGIDYGPGHRGIEEIYVGQDQVLAKLSLPSSVSGTKDQFVLHPSMLDSALQASVGIMMGADHSLLSDNKASHKPVLPFALQELEILGKCIPMMWALIRYSNGSTAGDKVQKLDVDLCDEQGTICVRMKGFSTRILEGEIQTGTVLRAVSSEVPIEPPIGTFMLYPTWDSVQVAKEQTLPSPTDQVVIVGGTKDNRNAIQQLYPEAEVLEIQSADTVDKMVKKLEAYGSIDHVLWIAPQNELVSLAEDTLIAEQNQGVLQIFIMIKAVLCLGYGTRDLGWTVITTQTQSINNRDRVNPTHASIHGLIGSTAKEYPNWKIRLIDLEVGCEWPINDLFTLPMVHRGHAWVYRNNEWYRQQLIPFQCPPGDQNLYKTGGVYVVIGGAGSIGEAWSEYMIRTYQSRIIWIGRREKDAAIQAKLDKLSALGPVPHYIAADASDLKDLQQAYDDIKQRYSQIHGLIHSAMVFSEQSLANMEIEQFKAGLSAKVNVSVNMARIFGKEPLNFILFFSSMITFIKNPKQSHYAAGCTFTDAFAHQLAHELPCTVKVMNWGYWDSVEATASEDFQQLAQIGIGLIEPEEGMKALETLLARPISQIALMKTTKHLAVEGMNYQESITVYPENQPSNIQNVQKHIPEKDLQAQRIKAATSRQTKEMDEFLCRLLWGQLQSNGLFTKKKSVIADLKTKTGLRALYDRWLDESITVLARHKYLKHDGETCSVVDATLTDMDALWKEWDRQKRAWLEDPNLKAQVSLLEAVLRALPEILTGKVPATEIMFPNSSMELVEGIYKNNLIADYFNEVLADTVVTYIQERLKQDSSAKIRIIEIGAGTGGTSAMVFQKLKPYRNHIQEYCYTDISKAFLLHAEKEYGPQNPYLTYKLFNLNAPVAGQEIGAGEFDIAIAANVLHATKNIRQTLHNTKAVLKNNGLLLLNEMTRNPLYIHLTFGLLEGWWLYEDQALRIPGCPGLYPETWEAVLKSEGFRSVIFPAQGAHDLGQQIIVAESNGVVRQQHQPGVTPLKKSIEAKTQKKQSYQQKSLAASTGEITQELLREKSTAYIKQLVGETLKISSNKIDSSEPLEKYGIDSIMVVQLTNNLRNTFANISTTLFFEYQTIDALVEHFLITQRDSLILLAGLDDQKDYDEASSDNGLSDEQPLAYTGLSLRKSRRFIQFRAPEVVGSESQPYGIQDVAIIGLSGRNAGADDVNEFWINLKEGRNCITEIPKERWDWKDYYDKERRNRDSIYTRWGGFIKDYDKFDPLFFYISPREADQMDPQERLFLEVAYASIEDAGYTPENLCSSRNVGVFVGVMNGDYPTGSCYWSIANRISYFLNFQGPSMAVDTACSSSLTAIHLALESLYSGVSECAIAGGVNLIVDPVHYKRLSAMTMLSSGDQCKAFGVEADGFVDGEGVGAIVLKPLRKAIADGDHIYGIIKGSMINAGGKTNGYTVPNPNAQFQLISEALQRARVHSRTVSYLEAHGTGTALGDPIEIAGLTRAFEQGTKDKQFCAIGSVKPNIGHCESASGIAGVAKVLLQLKYGQLVPSLHSKVRNPNIDFSNTPFVVQQELAAWKRPVVEINGVTREYPRIAGISSFGAGGSNAHIVIEEYIPEDQDLSKITVTTQRPAIIVLSAKNEERLREQVRQLLAFIQKQQFSDANLADMAYTLQVGREAMEERLAMIVGSIKELEEKLKNFVDGQESAELYRGQVKRHKKALAIFTADEDMEKTIDAWIAKGKYAKLLDLWVEGLIINWNNLYGDVKPRRISLPTYPFARERYWVNGNEEKYPGCIVNNAALTSTLVDAIQPLLHQNTSNIFGLQFTSTFTGQEFFLADDVAKGQRVLPGVACLEMTRAAVAQVAGDIKEYQTGIRLRNVIWSQPILVGDQPIRVHIGLFPEDNGEIAYEIYGEPGVNNTETVLYSQGRAELSSIIKVSNCNLSDLQANCSQSMYDPGHREVEKVYVGRGQVLAKLSLPSSVSGARDQFVLHPSLLDSALQVSAVLMIRPGHLKPILPDTLQELEILGNCTPTMWAWIRHSNGSIAEDKAQTLDIDLCDEQGTICVRMKGFRVSVEKPTDFLRDFFYVPGWKPVSLTAVQKDKADKISRKKVVIIYPSSSRGLEKALARNHGEDQVFFIKLGTEARRDEGGWEIDTGNLHSLDGYIGEIKDIDIIYFLGGIETEETDIDNFEAFERSEKQGVLTLFHLLKSLIRRGFSRRSLHLKIITNNVHQVGPEQEIKPFSAGLIGLGKSIAMEFPDMEVSCIDISLERGSSKEEVEALAGNILREPGHSKAEEVALRDGERYVRIVEPVLLPLAEDLPFKKEGVYVILGGAGGIGLELSNFLAERVQARLVLIGRSELNHEMKARIAGIESKGGKVLYVMADATDSGSMRNAIEKAKQMFGRINGVVHSAMTINDYTLENMSEEDFMLGFIPKTIGSLIIYQVTKDEPLDFMLFFSSVASFLPSVGASNYSVGVTFEDAFARYLNKFSSFPVKTINWGYWGNVGGGSRPGLDKLFAARGVEAHSVEEGMEAICRILCSNAEQFIAIKANERFLGNIGIDFDNQVEFYPNRIPSIIKTAIEDKFVPTVPDERLTRYDQSVGKLQELCRYQLLDSFNRMGVFLKVGERYDKEELKARLNIKPSYWRLYEAILVILAEAGFIENRADQVITTGKLEEAGLKEELTRLKDKREEIISDYPEVENHLNLLWTCHDCFFEVLRGEIPATDVIFPNSSMELVEGVYQGHAAADYFNGMVARFIKEYIEERLPLLAGNEKIKILEIGAGIGATSSVVFKDIKDFEEKLTYYYTDISPVFTRYGAEKYGLDNPYLEFKVLNIENEITDQGFDPGEVDVVIAANVIHATRNIPHTLRNLKRLLKRNGLLVLNELTGLQIFLSATFALLDGWWLYEDQENRIEGSPMLEPETWEKLLRAEGFKMAKALGSGKALKAHSQHVIIGESDGAVKYKMPSREATDSHHTAVYKPESLVQAEYVNEEYHSTPDSRETLQQAITVKMVNIIAGITQIGRQQIDLDVPFNELGVDSIFAAEIVTRINDEFSLKLKTNDLLNHPNIQLFVDFVVSRIGDMDVPLGEGQHRLTAASSLTEAYSQKAKASMQKPTAQIWPRKNMGMFVKKRKSLSAEPVAIIGVGGVMPKSADLESFWASLVEGNSLITEIPEDRWDWKKYYGDPVKEANKTGSKWGGFIKDIDKFDASLFNISPREAKYMDPQQRIFLEVVWNAIEYAGYKPSDLAKSRTGVFVGTGTAEYAELISKSNVDIDSLVLTGTGPSLIANRVSHFFDLKGPSEAIDTTCSGSAVAVHRAVNAIRRGECDMAIAGGVSLILSPIGYIGLAKSGMLSSSGVPKPFDRNADGFVLGEGAGAVLLKPLSQAVEDNDYICAVIRGSAVNHGGYRGSLISPDTVAQSDVIVSALEDAGVLPETLTYIESHGAGAGAGDMVELNAYHDAFIKMNQLSNRRSIPKKYCGIGSVKPNIGHLEAASGISALIKVIFALRDKLLPATLNFKEPYPEMFQDDSPFYIVDKTEKWGSIKDQEGRILPRRAGIHSFGFGGTNAHLILEEYLPKTDESAVTSEKNENGPQILVFSAKTDEVLKKHIENMKNYFKRAGKINLQDVAYTLLVGREAMEERLAIVVNSMDEAVETLDKVLNNQRSENEYMGNVRDNPGNVQEFPDKSPLGEKAVKLALLAEHWMHGGDIDWKSLGGSRVCKRISLPTYPFADERYWIDQIEAGNKCNVQSAAGCADLPDKMPGEVSDHEGRLIRQLIEMVSDTLEIPAAKIDPVENLKKYGFDSLTAIRMLNRIKETFGEAASLKNIVSNPTIRDFARIIARNGNAVSGREVTLKEDERVFLAIEESAGTSQDLKINGEDELFEFLVDELMSGRITSSQAAKLTRKLRTTGKRGINS